MNIAVFCPNWVGDLVMATPALRALRTHYPRAHLVGLLKPYVAGVLSGHSWFDETLLFNGPDPSQGMGSVAQALRERSIDLAMLFPNSFRSALAAWLGGSKRIVGYARSGRSLLLTDRLQSVRNPDGKFVPSPIIDAYNRLAEHVGCPRPGYQMRLYVTPSDEAAIEHYWENVRLDAAQPIVGLNTGGAFGAAKDWPLEHFVALARLLADRAQARVVVLCGPKEKEAARMIVQRAQRTAVTSLADEDVSIGLLKACVRKLDLLVTTDSGPRHFAAAFDKPVLTLFGPTHVQWTETYYQKALHLQKAVHCGPCQLRACPLDHRCMTTLSPQEVFDAATSLLSRWPRRTETKSAWGWLPFRREGDRRAS